MKKENAFLLYPAASLLFSAYVLTHPLQCVFSISKALSICTNTLIPSLFPFVFAAKFTSCVLMPKKKSTAVTRLISLIFGINENLAFSVIFGLFSGFPTGAVYVSEAYSKGLCTKKEAFRAICLSNNCSAAFLISGAGIAVLGKASYGVLLIICQALSVISAAQVLKLVYGNTYAKSSTRFDEKVEKPIISRVFTESIKSSCLSMLYITGFMVFFYLCASIITDSLSVFLPYNTHITNVLIGAALEVSTGTFACASLSFPLKVVFCAFCVCFPSLSVLFQVKSVCHEDFNISGEYVFCHVCMALFSSLYAFLFLAFFGEPSTQSFQLFLMLTAIAMAALGAIFGVKKITSAKRVKNVQKKCQNI